MNSPWFIPLPDAPVARQLGVRNFTQINYNTAYQACTPEERTMVDNWINKLALLEHFYRTVLTERDTLTAPTNDSYHLLSGSEQARLRTAFVNQCQSIHRVYETTSTEMKTFLITKLR